MRRDIFTSVRRAGLTAVAALMLIALPPSSARAELGEGGVRGIGLGLFPKWEATLQRFEAQRSRCDGSACAAAGWTRLLSGLGGLDRDALIRTIDRRVNAMPYLPDLKAWQQTDHWATPFEFLVAGGDCEDFAVAKYLALRSAGIAADAMRIAVVWDRVRRLHHAVLLVHEGGEMLVLDNLASRVRRWAAAGTYVPIYSINETSWWLHQPIQIGERPTLPSLGVDNEAARTGQRVEESDSNAMGNRKGGSVR